MVTLENITYEVKGKTLIKDVSANFEKAKINLILGPNGAGKSTLIKLINGELQATKGNILFEGLNLKQISRKAQAQFRAVLSQSLELSFPLSVHEVVLMGRYPHFESKPGTNDLEICEESMKLFDLQEIKARNYLTLSGGEKQRVQFARVWAQIWEPIKGKSRLLLLDEPLTFLDIYYQYDMMNKCKDFLSTNPDATVIGVVHDMNIAAKYADRIMLLKNSKVFDHGAVNQVLTDNNIAEVFRVVIENKFKAKTVL